MNDRELLELAAKAARLEIKWRDHDRAYTLPCFRILGSGRSVYWNPLEDYGEALKLLVGLNLDLRFESHECGVAVTAQGAWDDAPPGQFETFEQNGLEATCRAIVRAAAKIGSLL